MSDGLKDILDQLAVASEHTKAEHAPLLILPPMKIDPMNYALSFIGSERAIDKILAVVQRTLAGVVPITRTENTE